MEAITDKPSITAVLEAAGGRVIGRGVWAKSQCFAHEDRNPSASLNEEACKFHCFSCGFRGDSIDILMAWKGLNFKEAIDVARQSGFEFSESEGDGARDGSLRKSALRRGPRVSGGSRPGAGRGFRPSWRSL